MTTPAPSFAAISRVVFQPWSVRTTVSVFCFKSAISASCFPGSTFSRLTKITDSSDMEDLLVFRTHQGRPEWWKRIATWKIWIDGELLLRFDELIFADRRRDRGRVGPNRRSA